MGEFDKWPRWLWLQLLICGAAGAVVAYGLFCVLEKVYRNAPPGWF